MQIQGFLHSLRSWCCSYLAGRHELQRPKRTLHVGDIGLEFVQRGSDAGLDLRGLGPRRAVRRDLVQGLLRHIAGGVRVIVS